MEKMKIFAAPIVRALTVPVSLVMSAFAGGCGVDYYARTLITPNTSSGKMHENMLGSNEAMLTRGEIDACEQIAAGDGTLIDVWLLRGRADSPDETSRGTVVIIHGILDSKARYLDLAKRLADRGYDVVMPDLRAHGRSGGQYVTYGAKEHRDVLAVMDTLRERGELPQPFYALGVSMGAATAVQYAATDPHCRGVMAIAPFADLRSIAHRYVPLMRRSKYEAVLARAGEIGGFDPADASAVRAAARLDCPLIVVHGQLDNVVPFAQGKAVYEAAAGPKRLEAVPLAGHSTILLGREQWFVERIDELADWDSVAVSPAP